MSGQLAAIIEHAKRTRRTVAVEAAPIRVVTVERSDEIKVVVSAGKLTKDDTVIVGV